MPDRPAKRVLLIGWDAADWHFIRPMIDAGQMPTLQALMQRGAWGNIATLQPILSPMLWNTIATGHGPDRHGVLGFTEPSPDGQGVRPVRSTSRKCRALWNILTLEGMTSNVVGWYASHPAEPINGVMVSNQFEQVGVKHGEDWPVPEHSVYPPEMVEALAQARVHPGELDAQALLPFIPNATPELFEHEAYRKRLNHLAMLLAQTVSIHAATTHLIEHTDWDLTAAYYEGIDRFGHEFMHYHPPRMGFVDEREFELFKDVMTGCYRFHDMMLHTLLRLAGEDTTVILISDHGYHHADKRPGDPTTTSPTAWHRPFGIAVAAGPGIEPGQRLYGAGLSDVTPTVLHLLGLPAGSDMVGRVWVDILHNPDQANPDQADPAVPERILTWENAEPKTDMGDGRHPEDLREDPAEALEALRQLVDLGYIDPISDDHEGAIRKTTASNRMNLGVYFGSVGRNADARAVYEELADDPDQGVAANWHLLMLDLADKRLDEADRRLSAYEAELAAEGGDTDAGGAGDVGDEAADRDDRGDRDDRDDRGTNDVETLEAGAPRIAETREARRTRVELARSAWLLLKGRRDEAMALLEALATKTPDDATAQIRLGQNYLDTREYAAALARFERALALGEDNATAWDGKAAALLGLKRHDEAVDAALEAVGLAYGLPRAHLHLGQALVGIGEDRHARDAFEMCLKLAPRQAEAHASLADLLERLGEADAAFAHRQAARGKLAVPHAK